MPYLIQERKDQLDKEEYGHNLNEGDVNYLYTKFYITKWLEEQSYKTIHYLRKISLYPAFDTEFNQLNHLIKQHTTLTATDLEVARDLAFYEFMRRIGNNYENGKIAKNGDVYSLVEVQVAPTPIFQQEGDR